MRAVRLVATLLAVFGWLTLLGGLIGVIAVVRTQGSSLDPRSFDLQASAGLVASIAALVVVPLSLFFFWAVLTVLCALHDQVQRTADSVNGLKLEELFLRYKTGSLGGPPEQH